MQTTTSLLSPLAAAIVQNEFGKTQPIKLPETCYLYKLLVSQKKDKNSFSSFSEKEAAFYNVEIQLATPKQLLRYDIDVVAVSKLLHDFYYEQILAVIKTRFELRISIQETISYIYEQMGIDEDILAVETLVKRFYRVRQNKVTLSEKKGTRPVRYNSDNVRRKTSKVPRFSTEQIETKIVEISEQISTYIHFHPKRGGKLNRKRQRDVRAYVLHKFGLFRVPHIAKTLRTPQSTIYGAIKRIPIIIQKFQTAE